MATDFSQDPESETRAALAPSDDGMSSDENVSDLPPEVLQDSELPDEMKPYSQFEDTWKSLPEEQKKGFVSNLKKFHGDMSRGQTELGELRRRTAELEAKAQALDRLAMDPAFIQWHETRYSPPQSVPQQQAPPMPSKLTESLGGETVQELQGLLGRLIDERLNPLSQRIDYAQRAQVSDRMERDMRDLDARVREKGWPEVATVFPTMFQLMQQGRARTPEDAYTLATRDKIMSTERERGAKEKLESLRKKAQASFSPGTATPAPQAETRIRGAETDTIRAVRDAAKELGWKLD